jgi:hypothetical protein
LNPSIAFVVFQLFGNPIDADTPSVHNMTFHVGLLRLDQVRRGKSTHIDQAFPPFFEETI